MSSNRKKRGIDALVNSKGKSLKTGESITFRLIKGPSVTATPDPVDPKAPLQQFPLVAKFPESVVKPDFDSSPWKDARLFQQDVPKAAEDSDAEEEEDPTRRKKRWKYNRKSDGQRQWVLQEEVEFLANMVARKQKKPIDTKQLSSRYEGVPEHNSSHYVIMSAAPDGSISVQPLPTPQAVITFQQPASRQTLSLSQAEQAIQDQRAGIGTWTLQSNANSADSATQQIRLPQAAAVRKGNTSKSRLLGKMQKKAAADDDDDDGDDVMGDVAFKRRKGGARSSRREILGSFLPEGVKVSDDGVLGGTNDAAFGGRHQRFGQLQEDSDKKTEGSNKNKEERGADGLAMEDDFYKRDVKAEYEELDYDANEQFDDDDVDLGESEVAVDRGGFGEEEEEDDLEELDQEDDDMAGGVAGLATVAGFKAMLAKARGDSPVPAADAAAQAAANGGAGNKKEDAKRPGQPKADEADGDHMTKIMAAAEKSSKERASQQPAAPAPAEPEVQVDAQGLKIISLRAVGREIWLNHGSIELSRLRKIFDIPKKKKKNPARYDAFRKVILELCIMTENQAGEKILTLKQHYSNMG